MHDRCLSKRKDTNFKANHNRLLYTLFHYLDVCLSAKIRILKQITTQKIMLILRSEMFV